MASHKGKPAQEDTLKIGDHVHVMESVAIIDASIAKHPIPPATSTDENPAGELKKSW